MEIGVAVLVVLAEQEDGLLAFRPDAVVARFFEPERPRRLQVDWHHQGGLPLDPSRAFRHGEQQRLGRRGFRGKPRAETTGEVRVKGLHVLPSALAVVRFDRDGELKSQVGSFGNNFNNRRKRQLERRTTCGPRSARAPLETCLAPSSDG